MPTRRYALDPGGPRRLDVSWDLLWRNIAVKLEGSSLGTIDNLQALKAGRSFSIGDGSSLHVQLLQGAFGAELRVLRDDKPLPGSDSDPYQRVRVAAGVVFFIACLNLLLGLAVELLGWDGLKAFGLGYGSAATGLVYLILGYFVRKRSLAALVIAMGRFALDAIFALAFAAQHTGNPPIGGLVARIFLLAPMWRGIVAIRELKQEGSH